MSPWSPLVPLCLRLYLFVIDLTESRKVVFALVFPCQLALSPLSYPIFREQVPKSSSHSMRIRVRNPRERTIYLYYLEFFCKQNFPFTALFSCSSTCLHQYGPVHTYFILGFSIDTMIYCVAQLIPALALKCSSRLAPSPLDMPHHLLSEHFLTVWALWSAPGSPCTSPAPDLE